MKTDFIAYNTKFAELNASLINLGLDEKSGLQGGLRAAVHSAEVKLAKLDQFELTTKMLMMRRHEKDFILRGTQKYIDRLNSRVDEFKAFPVSLFGRASVKQNIVANITDYQNKFQLFAEGSMKERQLRKDVSASYAEIVPYIDAIFSFVVKKRKQVSMEAMETKANLKDSHKHGGRMGRPLYGSNHKWKISCVSPALIG